jgi:zinc protease
LSKNKKDFYITIILIIKEIRGIFISRSVDSRFYGRTDYINELDSLLARLTRDDVNNAIKKYWQTNNMFVTIVTDTSEAEPLAESLRKNLPSPMSYSNIVKAGLPEEVFKTDEIVAEYPLNVKNVKIVNSANTFK